MGSLVDGSDREVGKQSRSAPVKGRIIDGFHRKHVSYLVDPASSRMLVSKIKPCM